MIKNYVQVDGPHQESHSGNPIETDQKNQNCQLEKILFQVYKRSWVYRMQSTCLNYFDLKLLWRKTELNFGKVYQIMI